MGGGVTLKAAASLPKPSGSKPNLPGTRPSLNISSGVILKPCDQSSTAPMPMKIWRMAAGGTWEEKDTDKGAVHHGAKLLLHSVVFMARNLLIISDVRKFDRTELGTVKKLSYAVAPAL